MKTHGVQRILSGEDNVLNDASVFFATVTEIPAMIMQLPTFTEGTAEVTIDGTYTNIRDEIIEIEIVDNDATNSALVSEPVFTGVGNGTLTNHSRFGTAEIITVTLADLGNQTTRAGGVFNGVSVLSKVDGAAGNDIYFQVSQAGLTNNSTPYSLLKDLPAGTETVTSPEYEFDTAILSQYGNVPANVHRIRFGTEDNTIYRQVKQFVGGKWVYSFSPSIDRTIQKGEKVYFVTGGRDVILSDGVTTETYTNIITPYDLFSQIRQSSNLVSIASPLAKDESLGGNAAVEFDLRTDAYHYPSYGDGAKWATGLSNINIGANAATEVITLTCWAVSDAEKSGARLGQEVWHMSGSVSGSLSDVVTGVPYTHPSGFFGFTVPVKMPEGFLQNKGKITISKNITGTGACVEVINFHKGVNIKDGDYVFTWKKKPTTGTPDPCCAASKLVSPTGAIDWEGLGVPDPQYILEARTIKAYYVLSNFLRSSYHNLSIPPSIANNYLFADDNSVVIYDGSPSYYFGQPPDNWLSNEWEGGSDILMTQRWINAQIMSGNIQNGTNVSLLSASFLSERGSVMSGALNANSSVFQSFPSYQSVEFPFFWNDPYPTGLPAIPYFGIDFLSQISTSNGLKIRQHGYSYNANSGFLSFYFYTGALNPNAFWIDDLTRLFHVKQFYHEHIRYSDGVNNYIQVIQTSGQPSGYYFYSDPYTGDTIYFGFWDANTSTWAQAGTDSIQNPVGSFFFDPITTSSISIQDALSPMAGIMEMQILGFWKNTAPATPTPTPPPNPTNFVNRQLHVGFARSLNSIGETVTSDTTDASYPPINDYWHDGSVSNVLTPHYYHIGDWKNNAFFNYGPLGTVPLITAWAIAHHADSGYIDPQVDWYWQLVSVNSANRVSIDVFDQNPTPTSVVSNMTYDLYSGMVRSIDTSSFDTAALTNAIVLRADLSAGTVLTAYTGSKATYAEQSVDLFHNWELLGGTLELNDGTAWRDATNWWNGAGKKLLSQNPSPPFVDILDNLGNPIYPEQYLGMHGIRYTGQARRMGMLVDFDITALAETAGGSGGTGGNDQFGKWEVQTPTGGIIDYAYMNTTYNSTLNNVATGELSVALMSACMDKVEDGSTVTIKVENSSWNPTYEVGDRLYLPIIAAQDAHLSGGNTGDNITTWTVSGSLSGAKPPYLLDLDTPMPYSQSDASGTIDFMINAGAVGFETGDAFWFQVEGGHYRYRIDGGAWSPTAQLTLASVSIGNGLDLHIVPSVAPSFVAGDIYKFKALHPYSIDNAQNADWQQWCWTDAIGAVNYNLSSAKTINCVAYAFASLPVGTQVTFYPRLVGVIGSPITITTTSSMAGTAILPEPVLCDGISIEVIGTGCIGYLWAGMAWQPVYCAEVQVSTSSYMLSGGGYDARGQFIGTTTDAVFSSPEPFLSNQERDKLLQIYSYSKANNNQPIILVPNEFRPMSVVVGKIEADTFTLTDEFAHQPKLADDRYYTCSFSIKGVPNEKP